jgi:transcription initiation factor TFIIIB Brf1 subunit/transcription initiation factor TFIIB
MKRIDRFLNGDIYSRDLQEHGFDTYCPNCGEALVMYGYDTEEIYCTNCMKVYAEGILTHSQALNWFIAHGRKKR